MNEMHKILLAFEIKTDHLILARRPDIVLINKKKKMNLSSSGFCRFGGPQSERKRKVRQTLRPRQKLRGNRMTAIPMVDGAFGTISKGLAKRLEDLEVGVRIEIIQTPVLLRAA